MALTVSSCVISRPSPRSVPSICRRYLSFSPSVILRLAIYISQFAITQEIFLSDIIAVAMKLFRFVLILVMALASSTVQAQEQKWIRASSAHFLLFTDTSEAKAQRLLNDL